MRLRLNISIGVATAESRATGSLTDLIRARFEERRRELWLARNVEAAETSPGLVWRFTSPMEDYKDRWVPHRIVRQTAQSVLVEAHPCIPDRHSTGRPGSGRVRTYWVDRTELERLGFTRVRSRKTAFFASPDVSQALVTTVESVMRLGLWWPFSEDDVKQAYRRRALQVHPDAGGSEARFVQLQDDHDRAMRVLSQS